MLRSQLVVSNGKSPHHLISRGLNTRRLFEGNCFVFYLAVFAEGVLRIRIRDQERKKLGVGGWGVNTKGLSVACDSGLTNDQGSNANTTPRSKRIKLQNFCNDFQKLFCLLTAQIPQIQ